MFRQRRTNSEHSIADFVRFRKTDAQLVNWEAKESTLITELRQVI